MSLDAYIMEELQSQRRSLRRIEIAVDGLTPEAPVAPVKWGGSAMPSPEELFPAPDGINADDMRVYGYFSVVFSGSELLETLRWTPGTERVFPTFDQMAEARSASMKATGWDFSALGGEAHLFGIPLSFA
jgi:hypothetical protein